jgi:hypothetical protein
MATLSQLCIGYVVSNSRIIVNDELETMLKESVVTYFKVPLGLKGLWGAMKKNVKTADCCAKIQIQNLLYMKADYYPLLYGVQSQVSTILPIAVFVDIKHVRGLTINFVNLPLCSCCGSSGQKPQYALIIEYQRFTAVLLLIYGSLFLSGIYYCLSVFWCAVARMSELELDQRTNNNFLVKLGKSGRKIREMLVQVPPMTFSCSQR